MLLATRQFNGQLVSADGESKSNGPFLCPACKEEVSLRRSAVCVPHFSHKPSSDCRFGALETEEHRRCKKAIYEALLREPGVTKVALERSLTTCRPDVSAYIKGVPVAIEVQISSLSLETIIRRTEEYARKGIHVLWLLQWTPYLDAHRYKPRLWEKWIHACYFGRVYYWIEGLTVVSYHFEPVFERIPANSWGDRSQRRKSKRYCAPVKEKKFNLAKDFGPRQKRAWESEFRITRVKIFTER